MEILNECHTRRTLLLVSDELHDLSPLAALLSTWFTVAHRERSADYAGVMQKIPDFSVAVVCASDAAQNDFALFSFISGDSHRASIPLLIYYDQNDRMEDVYGALERGAVDVIHPPLDRTIILHRIQNALRLKDSATFYEIETMLKNLPSNIYLKDDRGRYVFATHYWHHIDHGTDDAWTIRGKTDLEIRKDRENAIKAMETDQEILRTGEGRNYIIEVTVDSTKEYLQIIKEPVRDADGRISGIIALINDVTDRELMRRRLERLALHDDLTGLKNHAAYRLHARQIREDIRNGKELEFALVVIDMNYLKKINDTYGHEYGNIMLRCLTREMLSIFHHSDIFRIGGDEFVVFVKDGDYARREELVRTFSGVSDRNSRDTSHMPWENFTAAAGYATYHAGTDRSLLDVFTRADRRMYEAKAAQKANRRD